MLSFVEGQPTPFAPQSFLPRVVIVPRKSAYPGFGGVRLLPGNDHVDVCKPCGRGDPIYAETLAFVRRALGLPEGGGGEGRGGEGGGGAAGAAAVAAAGAAR